MRTLLMICDFPAAPRGARPVAFNYHIIFGE
jgi:hypothetical protein